MGRWFGLAVAALVTTPVALLGACGGQLTPGATGATCATACTALASCLPPGTMSDCTPSCEESQMTCGDSEAFQALLDCVTGLSCMGALTPDTVASQCAGQANAVAACEGVTVMPIPLDASNIGYPPPYEDAGPPLPGIDAGVFDSSFDVPPIELDAPAEAD